MQLLELGDSEGHPFHGNQYSDGAGAREFLNTHYAEWRDNLTKAEQTALTFYQSPGYALMNGQLRGHDVAAPPEDLKRASAATRALMKAIAKAPPLERETVTHRAFDKAQLAGLKVGSTLEESGFTSLSLTKEGAVTAGSRDERTMRVVLPEGTRAGGGSVKELIVAPGASYEMTGPNELTLRLGTTAALDFGDSEGHPFHGNQWRDGSGGDARVAAPQRPSRFLAPNGKPMSRSQIGDTMEALVTGHPDVRAALRARFGGPITALVGHVAGKARQGPLDLLVGKHGAELKSVHADSTTQKTTIKREEADRKSAAAAELGLTPLQLGLVWEPRGGAYNAHLYAKEGFVPGAFATQFEHLGTFLITGAEFAAAYARAGYSAN